MQPRDFISRYNIDSEDAPLTWQSALRLSWPAKNKAKRFSRSRTFAFHMKFSKTPYFARQNRIAFYLLGQLKRKALYPDVKPHSGF
jgi:hypothetical protein